MGTERFLDPPPGPDYRPLAIGLGSNLGSRIERLRWAANGLSRSVLECARFSTVYETAPAHVLEQPDYLNACGVGWTRLAPTAVLDHLKGLEREAGRDFDAPRYGPRELDLDILLYADELVATERLTLPHPRLAERAFVLVPLAEIAGGWVHPVLGSSMSDLAGRIDRSGVEATNLRLDEE